MENREVGVDLLFKTVFSNIIPSFNTSIETKPQDKQNTRNNVTPQKDSQF